MINEQDVFGIENERIVDVEKTGEYGLTDTYTITFENGDTETFEVTNGNGIVSIEKSGSEGLVDTYVITYTNGTQTAFTVTNGEKGDKGNVLFATFDIDISTGILSATYDDEYDGATFSINTTTGELEVSIS